MPLTWTLKQWLRTHHGLTNPRDIQEIIHNQTQHKIPLRCIQSLLKKQPKTLDTEILQTICDVFRCHLSHFCAVKPSAIPPIVRTDINIHLQPCAIAAKETLPAFIARVQIAAISQALLMSGDNFSHACRLLGSERSTLLSFRSRHVAKSTPRSRRTFSKAIPLPSALFTISRNEDFKSFKNRIKLAALSQTQKLERNNTRAARRLGVERSTIIRLLKQI
jgi:transcriptional regulator of acetoin/glycerol metabolism